MERYLSNETKGRNFFKRRWVSERDLENSYFGLEILPRDEWLTPVKIHGSNACSLVQDSVIWSKRPADTKRPRFLQFPQQRPQQRQQRRLMCVRSWRICVVSITCALIEDYNSNEIREEVWITDGRKVVLDVGWDMQVEWVAERKEKRDARLGFKLRLACTQTQTLLVTFIITIRSPRVVIRIISSKLRLATRSRVETRSETQSRVHSTLPGDRVSFMRLQTFELPSASTWNYSSWQAYRLYWEPMLLRSNRPAKSWNGKKGISCLLIKCYPNQSTDAHKSIPFHITNFYTAIQLGNFSKIFKHLRLCRL